MSVAISYSHSDSEFGLELTQQIFLRGIQAWIDKCEIVAGESIYDKVQEAFSDAAVVLAILSPESVESFWCKKEVASAMTRELDEGRVVVIPVLLRDCEIPYFLKDKKYADFRESFDQGIADLMPAIEKYGVHNAGRIEAGTDDFTNDYSFDSIVTGNRVTLRFLLFQHSHRLPNSIFSDVEFRFNEAASAKLLRYHATGNGPFGDMTLVDWACQHAAGDEWAVVLESPDPVTQKWMVRDSRNGFECELVFNCRRLGDETGRATIVRGHSEIEKVLDIVRTRVRPPQP